MIFCILLLSGCIKNFKTDLNIKINNDLSSSININYNYKITDSIVKDEENTVTKEFIEIEKEAKQNKYIILNKPVKKRGEFLLNTYRYFSRFDVLSGEFSKELNRIGISNDLKIINTVYDSKVTFNGKISKYTGQNTRSYLFFGNTEIFITLPFKAKSNNAKYPSNNGKTLEWIVNSSDESTLFFDGKMSNNYNISLILFSLIIIVLIVLFIVFRNKLKMLKRI
jgi:hypothetical protein